MISNGMWQVYKNLINKVHDDFNQDTITWKRFIRGKQRYGEDDISHDNYTDINLLCLIAYNVFRTWPMTAKSVAGDLDKESIVVILNKKYLEDLGYLNTNSFFDMDPGKDKFIHHGLEYRASGETQVSQAKDEPLLFYIILSRQETPTGTGKY